MVLIEEAAEIQESHIAAILPSSTIQVPNRKKDNFMNGDFSIFDLVVNLGIVLIEKLSNC